MSVKLSIILVSYNSAEHLAESLPVLARIDSGMEREIIVVNNSPEDNISDLCGSHGAVLLEPGANIGFGAGINFGYAESTGDIILVLNPDAIPSDGALKAGIEHLTSDSDIGIVCPQLVYPEGARQESVRRFYTWKAAIYARSPFRNDENPPSYFREYMMTDEDLSVTQDIDWALGAAMFVRGELCRKMGGRVFDPRYFLYFEDVDLCYTCWRMGYRVVYHPDSSFVHHYERKSKKSPFSRANVYHLKSFMKYVWKHNGLPGRASVINE